MRPAPDDDGFEHHLRPTEGRGLLNTKFMWPVENSASRQILATQLTRVAAPHVYVHKTSTPTNADHETHCKSYSNGSLRFLTLLAQHGVVVRQLTTKRFVQFGEPLDLQFVVSLQPFQVIDPILRVP